MNGPTRVLLVGAVVVVAAAVAACGQSSEASHGSPAASAAAASPSARVTSLPVAAASPSARVTSLPVAAVSPSPDFLLPAGTFTATVATNVIGIPTGQWQLAFDASKAQFMKPGGGGFTQSVQATGPDEFTLQPDKCQYGSGEGRYRWSLTGPTLTLTKLTEKSACRATVLLSGPWVQVGGG